MALARATSVIRPRLGSTPARAGRERADRGGPLDHTLITPASHIRRCTFRRVTAVPRGRRELPMYDVECLHPSYDAAAPLGDLNAAYAACAACTLPGIFRPDED